MSQEIFQEAVRSARAGERERARDLFLDLVADQPRHERAWLWLSALLDDREDQIVALKNALKLNPDREHARRRLADLEQKKAVQQAQDRQTAVAAYQTAIAALRKGDRETARNLLLQVVAKNPTHERAWLHLSELMTSINDQIVALENVLTINPDHEQAQQQLQTLLDSRDDPFALATELRLQGRFAQARALYQQAQTSANAQMRLSATRQLAALEEEARVGRTPRQAAKTLLRLAFGPPLLYTLLVIVQIGFRPANLTLLYCLGGVGIVVGTVLVTGLQTMPRHRLWQKLFGPKGIRPLPVQIGLWTIGLLVVLLPFLLLAGRAAARLENFRTAVFGS